MTEPQGYYDQSIPPSLLMGRGRTGTARRTAGGGAVAMAAAPASGTTLTAGPDGYAPAVKAAERPKNLQELAGRVQPSVLEPWPQGASVPVGVRGKRAHWTGTEWKGGESPGYVLEEQPAEPLVPAGGDASTVGPDDASPAADSDSTAAAGDDGSPQVLGDASSPPAGTTFPGDETPGDLTR